MKKLLVTAAMAVILTTTAGAREYAGGREQERNEQQFVVRLRMVTPVVTRSAVPCNFPGWHIFPLLWTGTWIRTSTAVSEDKLFEEIGKCAAELLKSLREDRAPAE